MKRKMALGLFIMLLSVLGCKSSGTRGEINEPSWAMNTPTDSTYYYFVGYVEDMGTVTELKEKALFNAKAKIMSYIFEESSVQRVLSTSGSLGGNEDLQKSFEESIVSVSSARLSGVEEDKYEVQEVDDGGMTVTHVWVLVKIKKADVEAERQRIIEEMKRKLEMVDGQVRAAEQAIAAGKVLEAVNSYINAAVNSINVEERAGEFDIYINQALKILGSMTVEPATDNPNKADTASPTEFKFTVYYSGANGRIAVQGAKVTFTLRENRGDYTSSAISGANGVVACRITRLETVNNVTKLYAKIGIDVQPILNAGGSYSQQANALLTAADRVSSTYSFNVASEANLRIKTSVIAVVDVDGTYTKEPTLTTAAFQLLVEKGYSAVRFPDGINLRKLYELSSSELNKLANAGIMRVFILYVDNSAEPTFQNAVNMYTATYTLSAQLVDTATGQVISSKNIRLTGTSQTLNGVFSSFVSMAQNQLKKLIE